MPSGGILLVHAMRGDTSLEGVTLEYGESQPNGGLV